MRAVTTGSFIFAIATLCMLAVTIIVDVVGLGMIIYHTFKQPFEERPIEKIWHWAAGILILTGVVGFISMIAYTYGFI